MNLEAATQEVISIANDDGLTNEQKAELISDILIDFSEASLTTALDALRASRRTKLDRQVIERHAEGIVAGRVIASPAEQSAAAAIMGARGGVIGGAAKTEAKQLAARENGKKGGRPRKS